MDFGSAAEAKTGKQDAREQCFLHRSVCDHNPRFAHRRKFLPKPVGAILPKQIGPRHKASQTLVLLEVMKPPSVRALGETEHHVERALGFHAQREEGQYRITEIVQWGTPIGTQCQNLPRKGSPTAQGTWASGRCARRLMPRHRW